MADDRETASRSRHDLPLEFAQRRVSTLLENGTPLAPPRRQLRLAQRVPRRRLFDRSEASDALGGDAQICERGPELWLARHARRGARTERGGTAASVLSLLPPSLARRGDQLDGHGIILLKNSS